MIGRDLLEIHHVQSQRLGPKNSPFAQELKLGWVLIDDVCLDKSDKPSAVSVLKTNVISCERRSVLQPCQNRFHLTADLVTYSTRIAVTTISFKDQKMTIRFGLSLRIASFSKSWMMDSLKKKTASGKHNFPSSLPDFVCKTTDIKLETCSDVRVI